MKMQIIYISIISIMLFSVTQISMADMGTRRTSTAFSTTCADTDHDAICDTWEGVASLRVDYPTGTSSAYIYNAPCGTTASPIYDPHCIGPATDGMKDIFLEIDCFVGKCPSTTAVSDVINTFYQQNIRLHIQLGETSDLDPEAHNSGASTSYTTRFPGSSTNPGFDQIKRDHFGTPSEIAATGWNDNGWKQKQQVFHYALFVNKQNGAETSSGISEVFGNDMMISLGRFTNGIGSTAQQEGTLLHELGHNLNLQHGGGDNVNCKPNYLSVMSYSRQMGDLVSTRDLDYSRKAMGPIGSDSTHKYLDETAVLESAGLEGIGTRFNPDNDANLQEQAIWSLPSGSAKLGWTGTASGLDFDGDGVVETTAHPQELNELAGCGTSVLGEKLWSYNDWDFTTGIQFNFQDDTDAADGVSMSETDPTGSTTSCGVDPPDSFETDGCVRELSGGAVSGAAVTGYTKTPIGKGQSLIHPVGNDDMMVLYDGPEITIDDVLSHRELRYKSLMDNIQGNNAIPDDVKTTYLTELNAGHPRDNVDFYKIIRVLNKIENTMDDSTSKPSPAHDCIHPPDSGLLFDEVNSTKMTFQLAANFTETPGNPARFEGMKTALGQEFLGVPSDQVHCGSGKTLFLNGVNDRPACITNGHAAGFAHSHWVSDVVDLCPAGPHPTPAHP